MALAKVKITIESTGESIYALFNPEEYTVNKDNNYASQAIPGLSGPILQFVHGNMGTLDMELFFDTYDTPTLPKQDVRDVTNLFVNLLAIDPDLHAPPIVDIAWASLQFRGVLAKASQKYILFMDDGTPVRARVTCTFNEFIDPEHEAKQINRQTADFTKVHVVAQGETLSGIATTLYQNPQAWRPIAIQNGIDDPRSIVVGQRLLIPSLPFIDPETREVVT